MPEINWKSQGIFSFLAQKETAGCLILHFSAQRQKNWDSEGGFTAFSAAAAFDFNLIHDFMAAQAKSARLRSSSNFFILRSSSSFRFFLSSISRFFILNGWIRTSYLSRYFKSNFVGYFRLWGLSRLATLRVVIFFLQDSPQSTSSSYYDVLFSWLGQLFLWLASF